MMKILHTSDWHIGRLLHGRKRYAEHAAFLDWLAELIEREGVNVLLVSGDVFDTSTPSNYAQELYYRFLCRVAAMPGRHVVITAGNHDSPSFLQAPRELLRFLNVHVVASAAPDPEDEVVVINTPDGKPALFICAVPYLRDKDIRQAEAGESMQDKERKLIEGIAKHYDAVCAQAREMLSGMERQAPLVLMGHLFAAGSQTSEGEGMRELYVGSLGQVGGDIFSPDAAYVALGHLHVPQRVAGLDHIRYSGSPIPMSFGEAGQEKSVVVLELGDEAQSPAIKQIAVPCFQQLKRVRGDWDAIAASIEDLKARGSVWLEVVYTGLELITNLRQRLDDAVTGSKLEILTVKNNRVLDKALGSMEREENLDEMDITDVFQRCLDAHDIAGQERGMLLQAYHEIIADLRNADPMAG